MDYLCVMTGEILALIYTIALLFLLRKSSFYLLPGLPRNAVSFAFIVKILCGIAFWAIYTYHDHYRGKSDALLFFNDGIQIYKVIFESPLDYLKILLGSDDPELRKYIIQTGHWDRSFNQGLYNETRTVIRFNAIAALFSFGHYHVHTVIMCFLSLTGLTGLYRAFHSFLRGKEKELFVVIFLIPSVLFWGSGVSKEGIILFSMGLLVYAFFKWVFTKPNATGLLLFIFSAFILSITKIYLLLVLIPAMIAMYWLSRSNFKYPLLKFLLSTLPFIVIVLLQNYKDIPFMLMEKQRQNVYQASGGTHLGIQEKDYFIYISPDETDPIQLLKDRPGYCRINNGTPYVSWYYDDFTDSSYQVSNNDTTAYWIYYHMQEAGSRIETRFLNPTYKDLFYRSPEALFTSLFRPHWFDVGNIWMFFAAAENTLFILLILLILVFFQKPGNASVFIFCLWTAIPTLILIGLTTPVLGSVVRYKAPALVLLTIALLILFNKAKFKSKLGFDHKNSG